MHQYGSYQAHVILTIRKERQGDGMEKHSPFLMIVSGSRLRPYKFRLNQGGGPASSASGGFYWGPSVSWNTYLDCWVMLMGKVTGPSWAGNSVFISFNKNKDLGNALQSQEWTTPAIVV